MLFCAVLEKNVAFGAVMPVFFCAKFNSRYVLEAKLFVKQAYEYRRGGYAVAKEIAGQQFWIFFAQKLLQACHLARAAGKEYGRAFFQSFADLPVTCTDFAFQIF